MKKYSKFLTKTKAQLIKKITGRSTNASIMLFLVVAVIGFSVVQYFDKSTINATNYQATLIGYSRQMSWEHGVQAKFSFSFGVTKAIIYQMGTNGLTGTKVATIPVTNTKQPTCLTLKNGSADCGNWLVNAWWKTPTTLASSIYRAVPVDANGNVGDPVPFVIRCDECSSDIVAITSDATWQAYNTYGGGSLYHGNNPLDPQKGREYRVSYNRPLVLDPSLAFNNSLPENAEYAMLNYLTANGFSYTYVSQLDVEANPSILLNHKIVLTSGHLEYVSNKQRAAIQSAINAGESYFNATGNDYWWKIDPQPSIDTTKDPYRTIVCYKETLNNTDINPSSVWTGTWRDKRFSPPNDGGRPENTLTGQLYTVDVQQRNDSIQFSSQQGQSPFLRNTAAASLASGAVLTMPAGTLGYEWDEIKTDNQKLPANEVAMSTEVVANLNEMQPNAAGDYSKIVWNNSTTATHQTSLYQAGSGAWVFSSGNIQWSWGLSNDHARFVAPTANQTMQQATMNLLIDMGANPSTPQSGLTVSPPESFSAYQSTLSPVTTSVTAGANFPSSQIQYSSPQPLSGEDEAQP